MKTRDYIIITLIIALSITAYHDYTEQNLVFIKEPVYLNRTIIETVETPVIVYEPVIFNQTHIVKEYEVIETVTPMPLRHFPDKATLYTYIIQDDTDNLPYTDRWTCFDYTIRTIENAESQGYRIYFFYRNNPDGTAHAMCMAYVVDEAQYIIWEPQTDQIQFTWSSNIAGQPAWFVPTQQP